MSKLNLPLGPWKSSKPYNESEIHYVNYDGSFCGPIVIYPLNIWEDQSGDVARLISAAPDMYEALKVITDNIVGKAELPEWQAFNDAAKAAIAKAEGAE